MVYPLKRLPLPSWALNLIGFGLLITLVLVVFSVQLTGIDHDLRRSVLARSRVIAVIIEENLRNATLAQSTIDTVVTSLLRDKARFVDYLQTIDPLQPEELTALVRETGLLGINLVRKDGTMSSEPRTWLPSQDADHCHPPSDSVQYDPQRQLAWLTAPATAPGLRCIHIGLGAEAIVRLQHTTSLPVLLATLSRLPGIRSVHLDPAGPGDREETTRLVDDPVLGPVAEARLPTTMGLLVVALDAGPHQARLQQMRQQFLLFAGLLLFLGCLFSWLLLRAQRADLERTRSFERILAKEHEAAALGRATATIAHEVRNPLNALSMGLQRFTLESERLEPEQRQLLEAMNEAVRRAGTIITELQRFTRKLEPRRQPVQPHLLLQQLLALYQPRCVQQGITLTRQGPDSDTVDADPDLLAELMENLLKNAIEAQPGGGFITIATQPGDHGWILQLTNGGCTLGPAEVQRLGEPYFTTKVRGTGLGLALCRRIAEAHGGTLTCTVDGQRQEMRVQVCLPAA